MNRSESWRVLNVSFRPHLQPTPLLLVKSLAFPCSHQVARHESVDETVGERDQSDDAPPAAGNDIVERQSDHRTRDGEKRKDNVGRRHGSQQEGCVEYHDDEAQGEEPPECVSSHHAARLRTRS